MKTLFYLLLYGLKTKFHMPYGFLFYVTVLKKWHQQLVVQIFVKVPANIVLLTSIQFSSAGEHIP